MRIGRIPDLHDHTPRLVRSGEHACLVSADLGARTDVVSRYLLEGLRRGEQGVYAGPPRATAMLVRALQRSRVDIASESARGALFLLDADETYGCGRGSFDPRRVPDVVVRLVERSTRAGFGGLRLAGEAARSIPPSWIAPVLEYERFLDRYLPAQPATALCVYDESGWSREVIAEVRRVHPVLVESAGTASVNHAYRSPHAAKVLVVEDDSDAGETLTMILEMMGHRAAHVSDAAAALAAARRSRLDAMLIDIGLPGMDGYQLARRVRSDPALRELVLIAITGYGGETDRTQAVAAGFDRHMLKPANPEELQALLARLDELRAGKR